MARHLMRNILTGVGVAASVLALLTLVAPTNALLAVAMWILAGGCILAAIIVGVLESKAERHHSTATSPLNGSISLENSHNNTFRGEVYSNADKLFKGSSGNTVQGDTTHDPKSEL